MEKFLAKDGWKRANSSLYRKAIEGIDVLVFMNSLYPRLNDTFFYNYSSENGKIVAEFFYCPSEGFSELKFSTAIAQMLRSYVEAPSRRFIIEIKDILNDTEY